VEGPPSWRAIPDASTAKWGEFRALYFKGRPVRSVALDGVPWFALEDICAAVDADLREMQAVHRTGFPEGAKTVAAELPSDGDTRAPPDRTLLLSPIGVFYWTNLTAPWERAGIAAWAKREALKAFPDAPPDNPHVFLTITPEGLPDCPGKYSGRRAEYEDLRWSEAYAAWASAKRRGMIHPTA